MARNGVSWSIRGLMILTAVAALLLRWCPVSAVQLVGIVVMWDSRQRLQERGGKLLHRSVSPGRSWLLGPVLCLLTLAMSVAGFLLFPDTPDDLKISPLFMAVYYGLSLRWARPELREHGLLHGANGFNNWGSILGWWWGRDRTTLHLKIPLALWSLRIMPSDADQIQAILEDRLGASKQFRPVVEVGIESHGG